MAIVDGYCTLADLKARLDITTVDAARDTVLEQVIEAASRQVDGWCGRPFASGEATRQLTADNSGMVIMPNDLHTISEIAVDRDDDRVYETIWPIESVDLQPYPGPYQVIRPRRGYNFPTHRYAIQITGVWGYGENTPAAIREATLLQAARLYKRKDAPFGVAGNAEHGQLQTISSVDPDVKELLKPYMRHWMVV